MSYKEDLKKTLPEKAPELQEYGKFNWDDSSFAMYTTIDMSVDELQPIAAELGKQWADEDLVPPHLVRIQSEAYKFTSGSLKDIVDAHIKLDKDITWRDDGGAEGDLHWYPTAFLVVTSREWKTDGILFVYVLDEDDDPPLVMDCFWFDPKESHIMLSSIHFGDESFDDSKNIYDIDKKGEDEGEDEGDE